MHPCYTAPGHMSDILFITTASHAAPSEVRRRRPGCALRLVVGPLFKINLPLQIELVGREKPDSGRIWAGRVGSRALTICKLSSATRLAWERKLSKRTS